MKTGDDLQKKTPIEDHTKGDEPLYQKIKHLHFEHRWWFTIKYEGLRSQNSCPIVQSRSWPVAQQCQPQFLFGFNKAQPKPVVPFAIATQIGSHTVRATRCLPWKTTDPKSVAKSFGGDGSTTATSYGSPRAAAALLRNPLWCKARSSWQDRSQEVEVAMAWLAAHGFNPQCLTHGHWPMNS